MTLRQLGILCLSAFCATGAIVSCGGGDDDLGGAVTVSGVVNNATFAARDASVSISSFAQGASGALIRISNVSDACGLGGHAKGELALTLLLVTLNGGVATLPTKAGDFRVVDRSSGSFPSSGNAAFVVFESSNEVCAKTELEGAEGGRVSVTKIDLSANGAVEGDLDLLLQNGNRLRGKFSGEVCPAKAPDAGTPACQ